MTEENKWDIDYTVDDPMTKEEREAFKEMTPQEQQRFLQEVIIPRLQGQ